MIDLERQYIIQCFVNSANTLRLSSEKIEVVALLKEHFNKVEDIKEEIFRLKKITEFSKFAVKMDDVLAFVSKNNIDLLQLSDNLKDHIHFIVKEVSNLLDVLTPITTKGLLNPVPTKPQNEVTTQKGLEIPDNIDFNILQKEDVKVTKVESKNSSSTLIKKELEKESFSIELPKASESDLLKEDYILDELNAKTSGFTFDNYEDTIMKPVKELDQFLKKINLYEYTSNEYDNYIRKMRTNADLSSTMGFEIISQMHIVFARGMELLRDKVLNPTESVVEGLRSCLIVIVAVVRSKDVDITAYLSRAESFGKKLMSSKFNKDEI